MKSIVTAFLLGAIGIWGSSQDDRVINLKAGRPHIAPPAFLRHFTFGYSLVIADTLWIRLLQDIDFCEGSGPRANQAQYKKEKGEALGQFLDAEVSTSQCLEGWAFQMMDSITELDPKFVIPYRVGATILSVAVDDREGARKIFEKGLKQYPNDWVLAYRAAYHYLIEVRDAKRAGELMLQAAKNGAPSWTAILAARLYTKSGQIEVGRLVLEDFIRQHGDSEFAEQARKRLKMIEKEYGVGQ